MSLLRLSLRFTPALVVLICAVPSAHARDVLARVEVDRHNGAKDASAKMNPVGKRAYVTLRVHYGPGEFDAVQHAGGFKLSDANEITIESPQLPPNCTLGPFHGFLKGTDGTAAGSLISFVLNGEDCSYFVSGLNHVPLIMNFTDVPIVEGAPATVKKLRVELLETL